MAYVQLPTRVNNVDTNSAADINQVQDNIDAILGTEASSGPAKTLVEKQNKITPADGYLLQSDENGQAESSGIASSDAVTASANFANDEILLGAGANKTVKKSGKAFEDTPTNSTAKITTSQHFYDLENSYVESVGSNNVETNFGAVTSGVFTAAGSPTLTLGVGKWEIFGQSAIRTAVAVSAKLSLYNNTDASVFGIRGGGETNGSLYSGCSCSGVITITSGTKNIRLRAEQDNVGGGNLYIGSRATNISCGYLSAKRIA